MELKSRLCQVLLSTWKNTLCHLIQNGQRVSKPAAECQNLFSLTGGRIYKLYYFHKYGVWSKRIGRDALQGTCVQVQSRRRAAGIVFLVSCESVRHSPSTLFSNRPDSAIFVSMRPVCCCRFHEEQNSGTKQRISSLQSFLDDWLIN